MKIRTTISLDKNIFDLVESHRGDLVKRSKYINEILKKHFKKKNKIISI